MNKKEKVKEVKELIEAKGQEKVLLHEKMCGGKYNGMVLH